MKNYRLIRGGLLSTILIISCMRSGIAEAQLSADGQPGPESLSVQEQAKQAANPLTNIWLLQFQQNNDWLGMPFNGEDRVQNNLQFQPLLSVRVNDDWSLVSRPVVQLFNSSPYVDQTERDRRATGFGDTVLALALAPGRNLVGNWLVALGPTFIFPTASNAILAQNKWQMGPVAALGYQGEDYITYVLTQQWFSFAGNGRTTNQMATYYAFVRSFESGWTVGTQSQFIVDWQAPARDRVTFPVGLQVGKLVHLGPLPVKIDLQASYYPIHPDPFGPKWGIQLQITPMIPSLINGTLFGDG